MSVMLWDKGSSSRSSCCPLGHDGLPLLLHREVNDLQTLCSLLQTSKAVRDAALAHCSVPLLCRPGTLEQAERTAAWIAKYGSMLASFDWQTTSKRVNITRCPNLDPAARAAAFAALAAALQQAAATPRGLGLQSCKLASVSWDCDVILQQLPVNTLTSLDLSFDFGSKDDFETCLQRLAGVKAALQQLQQLRKLVLDVEDGTGSLPIADPLLEPLSSLTNLTSLEVGTLWSLRELQHVPPRLLELEHTWQVYDAASHPLKLSHLTALTKLTTGYTAEIFHNAELPLSLRELQCGRLPYADTLLPLRYLQRLEIQSCMSTAAELERLSSLTSLTHISVCYSDSLYANPDNHSWYAADEEITPEATSAAWPALASQLRELHIIDGRSGGDGTDPPFQLSADAVDELRSLTALTSLSLMYLQCPEVTPQQLAAALRRCTALQELELGDLQLQWGPVPGLTGDADADVARIAEVKARGMQTVAAGIAGLPSLQKLSLSRLPVDMHAAAALAAAAAGAQLTRLSLKDCELTDCSMNVLALGLTSLKSLEIRYCEVGDASLPALARLQLQRLQWSGCRFTDAALDLFMPK